MARILIHNLTQIRQAYRRGMDERWDRMMYTRDKRITGNPYIQNVRAIRSVLRRKCNLPPNNFIILRVWTPSRMLLRNSEHDPAQYVEPIANMDSNK